MQKPSATIVTGAIAIVVALSIFAELQWRASTATIAAGFWYEDFSFTLPAEYTVRLSGSLPATRAAVDEGEPALGATDSAVTTLG